MPKVQGQEPALEETRNSKVTAYFSFTLFYQNLSLRKCFFYSPLIEGKNG
jgi:hypothetical protein